MFTDVHPWQVWAGKACIAAIWGQVARFDTFCSSEIRFKQRAQQVQRCNTGPLQGTTGHYRVQHVSSVVNVTGQRKSALLSMEVSASGCRIWRPAFLLRPLAEFDWIWWCFVTETTTKVKTLVSFVFAAESFQKQRDSGSSLAGLHQERKTMKPN
jgi:hypothetical protein